MTKPENYDGTLGFSQNISPYHHGYEGFPDLDRDSFTNPESFPECNPPTYEVKNKAPLKSKAKPKAGIILPKSLDNLITHYSSQKYINN